MAMVNSVNKFIPILLAFTLSAATADTTIKSSEIRGDVDWWKKAIVYQIYPRSFQDSNDDGVGDLQGIISRLDYFNYIGVDAIWISPVYKSPMVDFGYDIEDFRDIDPTFGTLADFDQLIKEAHERGIYVIMDYIPNHTSDRHKWFVESQKGGKNNPYSDFYIWSDGKLLENGTRAPPNKWVSCFATAAWTWHEGRGQYYYHQFVKEQPDLNYRNPVVVEEMKKIFTFWLDRGVDGFRIDAIGTLYEVEDLTLEEPRSFLPNVEPHEQYYLDHIYTRDQPEIHDVIRAWRELFDEHDRKHGGHTFMVTEVYTSMEETVKYYDSGADLPFNLIFIVENLTDCGGACFQRILNKWLDIVPENKWPNFVIGNHDKNRISYRKGKQYVDSLNVMLLTMPGTPTTYYGEELGLNDIDVSYEDTQDPWGKNLGPELYRYGSRDPCRAPMQWSDAPNAGFTTAASKPWLPVHPDYTTRNVKAQRLQRGSPLHIYRRTVEIRKKHEFQTNHVTFAVVNDNILSYVRYVPGCASSGVYLVAMNLGKVESTDDYTVDIDGKGYTSGVIILDTETVDRDDSVIRLKEIKLKVGQAVILRLLENLRDEL